MNWKEKVSISFTLPMGMIFTMLILFLSCTFISTSTAIAAPTIAQTPMQGPAGTTFAQWGSGFTPNSTAILHFQKPDGSEYLPADRWIDDLGNFDISYPSEDDKPPGTYSWWAIDGPTGEKSNVVTYVIEARPIVAQTPMEGLPGTAFAQWGSGLTALSTAKLYVQDPDGVTHLAQEVSIDNLGNFETTYGSESNKTPGFWSWYVEDATGLASNWVTYKIIGGKISGRVFNNDRSMHLDGIENNLWIDMYNMTWNGANSTWTKVKSDGTYSIDTLQEGTYWVSANRYTAPGYAVEYWTSSGSTPHSGDEYREYIDINIGDEYSGIDFTLDRTGSISGVVYASDGTTKISSPGDYWIHLSAYLSDPCVISNFTNVFNIPEGDSSFVETMVPTETAPIYLKAIYGNNDGSNSDTQYWNSSGGSEDCRDAEVIPLTPGGHVPDLNFILSHYHPTSNSTCSPPGHVDLPDSSDAFGIWEGRFTKKKESIGTIEYKVKKGVNVSIQSTGLIDLPLLDPIGIDIWSSIEDIYVSSSGGVGSWGGSAATWVPNNKDHMGYFLAKHNLIAPGAHTDYTINFCTPGTVVFEIGINQLARNVTLGHVLLSFVGQKVTPEKVIQFTQEIQSIPLIESYHEHITKAFSAAGQLDMVEAYRELNLAVQNIQDLGNNSDQAIQLVTAYGKLGLKITIETLISKLPFVTSKLLKVVGDSIVLLVQTDLATGGKAKIKVTSW